MQTYDFIYGIDVGSANLDIMEFSKEDFSKIENTDIGILDWISELPKSDKVLCVLEATGAYSQRIVYHLQKNDIKVAVVNPLQSSGFAQAQGIISKDDRQAAKTLALMGNCLDLPIYKYPSEDMQKRKQIIMAVNALKKQKQMLKNQLHALSHQIIFSHAAVDALEKALGTVETELTKLEEELSDISDEEHKRQFDLLISVKGIGPKTAHLLLCTTGGLQHFSKAKQLSKFIGLVPSSHRSGTSVRIKGKITKRGNNALRGTLFMAGKSAVRYNIACRELYQRLRKNGKPYKKAMVAVMNKLVKQAFGVVQSDTIFDNQKYLAIKKD